VADNLAKNECIGRVEAEEEKRKKERCVVGLRTQTVQLSE